MNTKHNKSHDQNKSSEESTRSSQSAHSGKSGHAEAGHKGGKAHHTCRGRQCSEAGHAEHKSENK